MGICSFRYFFFCWMSVGFFFYILLFYGYMCYSMGGSVIEELVICLVVSFIYGENVDGMWMDRRIDRYRNVPNVGIISSLILSLSGLNSKKSHGVILC